jgi:hypothetical protein
MFFFDPPKLIYYLPTYLPIKILNNNPKKYFYLGIKSNDPLSTSQIISHSTSQNGKVQFDCKVALDMYKSICPNWQGGFLDTCHFWDFFTSKPNKKNHEL